MENTSITNLKTGNSKNFLVFCHDIASVNALNNTNDSNFKVANSIEEADLFVQFIDNTYLLKYHINDKYRVITVNSSNFNYALQKVQNILSQNSLGLQNITNSIKKNKSWNEDSFFIEQLNNLIKDNDLITFTLKLFELNFFNKFNTIHLFIHEKGLSTANHLQISRNDSKNSEQPISEFTQLFNAIKKSKNRSFGQSSLKASSYQILGTCLAHELQLDKFNLIFLITKNDFLPQEQTDVNEFTEKIKILKYFLNLALNKELILKKTQNNYSLIKLLSESTSKKQDEIIFSPTQLYLQDIEKALNKIQNSQFNSADVHHQERITLLGELLNTLKHELSNPLFGLQLTTDLLKLEELDEEQSMFITEISNAITRSQNIINNFSNIYNEKPNFEDVEVISLLKEVIILTKSESKTIRKEINLDSKDVLNRETDLILNTNKTWLAQIFFNLIINSSQAIKEASISSPTITINIETESKGIKIIFQDNGPGLSTEAQNYAFQPFFTTKSKGTGLGLSITNSLVHKLSGEIEYIPNDNGARFLIKLPYESTNNRG